MATREDIQVSEAQIAVHWREEEYYQPPAKFIAQANVSDPAIFERFSEEHFPDCFKEYADLLDWDSTGTPPWTPATRRSGSGSSAAGSTPRYNCVDRHLATRPEQGGLDLGARTGERGHAGDHLPGALRAGQRIRRRCCATSPGCRPATG